MAGSRARQIRVEKGLSLVFEEVTVPDIPTVLKASASVICLSGQRCSKCSEQSYTFY